MEVCLLQTLLITAENWDYKGIEKGKKNQIC